MDLGIEEKAAPVLGGGGGLGRATAKPLATEGANVAAAGIRSTGKSIGLIWDLADLSVLLRDRRLTTLNKDE